MSARWEHNGAGTRHRAARNGMPPRITFAGYAVMAGIGAIVAHTLGVIL